MSAASGTGTGSSLGNTGGGNIGSTNTHQSKVPWMILTCTAGALALAAYLYHLHTTCSELMDQQRQGTSYTAQPTGDVQKQRPRVYELVYMRRDPKDANVWVFDDASAPIIAAMRAARVGLMLADGSYYSVQYVTPTRLRMTPLATSAGASVDNSTLDAPGLTLHVVGWSN